MKNRTWQILKTYWKRPLIQLLTIPLVTMIAALAALLVLGQGSKGVSIGMRPHNSGRVYHVYTETRESERNNGASLETISQLLKRVKPNEVLSLSLVCLNVGDPLPDLRVLPNLRYLSVSGFDFSLEDIDHLCALPMLNSLVIERGKLPPGTLAKIGNKVSELQLQGLTLEAHQADLPEMKKVRLLAVGTFMSSTALINHITVLTNIEILTLMNSNLDARHQYEKDHWHEINLSSEEIATLKAHPKLKEIYADWSDTNSIDRAQMDELRPLRAFPTSYSMNRLIALNLTWVASFLVFAIIATQLWAQFISPAAVMVPHYLKPHRNVALGVMIVCLLAILFLLMQYKFPLVPSLCIVLFFPASCCLYSYSSVSGRPSWVLIQFPFLFASIFFCAAFSSVIFEMYAGSFIWFFRGNMPILTSIAVLIEVACVGLMYFNLRTITEMVNEKSEFTPGFSFWDAERAQKLQMQQASNSWLFRWLDESVSNLRYRGDSTLQMVHLWRSGNLFRPIIVLVFIAAMIVGGVVIQFAITLISGEDLLTPDFGWIVGALSAPWSIGLVLPALTWWQRRKSLEAEFLKPVKRKDFIKQLYLALAFDHWILLVGVIGVITFQLFQGPENVAEFVCLSLLACTAFPLWVIGISMSVFVFKESWQAVATMIGLYVIAIAASALLALGAETYSAIDNTAIVYTSLATAGAIAAAIGLNIVMYKVALRREWG